MPDDTTCRIRVSYSSYIIYDATIQMKSDEKSVKIRSTIFKNSEAKKIKVLVKLHFIQKYEGWSKNNLDKNLTEYWSISS